MSKIITYTPILDENGSRIYDPDTGLEMMEVTEQEIPDTESPVSKADLLAEIEKLLEQYKNAPE